MRGFAAVKRAFSPLDTTAVCAAIDRADVATRAATVSARAVSMAIGCGDRGVIRDTVQMLANGVSPTRGTGLRAAYGATQPTPSDMQDMLNSI
ncbi:MAG TPA: hypothetical protein VF638_03005 [Sphingomonas sp.]